MIVLHPKRQRLPHSVICKPVEARASVYTRILINRPLLSHTVTGQLEVSDEMTTSTMPASSPSPNFIRTCREAALEVSWAGNLPIFKEASATYARNFISLHLLTAGVTLCIMTSSNPLSQESYESKLGIRRLIEMQASLKLDSIVAEQGLQLLKRLLALVMRKETQCMLRFGSPELMMHDNRTSTSDIMHSARDSHHENTQPMSVVQENQNDGPTHQPFSTGEYLGVGQTSNPSPSLPLNIAPQAALPSFERFPLSQAMLEIEQGSLHPHCILWSAS